MTTVVLPPKPPWVVVALDTTGPDLDLVAPGVIQPPDVLEVLVTTSEPVDGWVAYFTDQAGSIFPLGVEVTGSTTGRVLMATTSIGSGRGTITVLARDLAGNTGSVSWSVLVDRPRAFDIETETLGVYDVATSPDAAFEIETDVEHAFDVSTLGNNVYEANTDVLHAFSSATEMTDG